MKKYYIIVCDDEEESELVQIKILGHGFTWSEVRLDLYQLVLVYIVL